MKYVKLLLLFSLIFISIERKTNRKTFNSNHLQSLHRKLSNSQINDTLKTRVFIYTDTGFNLNEFCIVTIDNKDIKTPEGDKKKGLFVTVEKNCKFAFDNVFRTVSENVYYLPYQYLSTVKSFSDTDKYRYFYVATTYPKYYNIAFQFSQRGDYDDTISITTGQDFNTIVSDLSKSVENRKSFMIKLKEAFLSSANNYYTIKQKTDASSGGLDAIKEQISKMKKALRTLKSEKIFLEGSDEGTLNAIQAIEKELMELRSQLKKTSLEMLQKGDLIKKQTESLESLRIGTKSAKEYSKEFEIAKQNYLTAGNNYKGTISNDSHFKYNQANDELLINNNYDNFSKLIDQLI